MEEKNIFTGERFVPGIDDDEITIEHYQRYESILELVKDKTVVDAACGEGYGSSILSSVAKKVIGLDLSEEAVKRANDNYGTEKVKYYQGDISNLPFEDHSIEVFVSFETIEHVDKELQVKFINEVSRVLEKDGLFIISSPNKAIYSDLFNYNNEFHIHEMYKDEFIDLLKSKFEHVKLFHQYLEVGSFIDSNENTEEKAVYKKNKSTYNSDGKYFIAVVSNQPVDHVQLQSVFLKYDVTYRKNMLRILELQKQIEERNLHLEKLDAHIEELGGIIKFYSEKEKEYLCKENKLLADKSDLLEKEVAWIKKENEYVATLAQKENEYAATLAQKDELIQQKTNLILSMENEHSDKYDVLKSEYDEVMFDYRAKETHIRNIEAENIIVKQERDSLINELHTIAYYRKHPVRRVYRVTRRLGAKIWRKLKKIIRKVITPSVYRKKIVIPTYAKPKVSIVIPVYNEFDYTYGCIKSLVEKIKNVSYEIIVGDDESTDDTKNIKRFIKNIKVNKNHSEHGFLMNCNRAAKLAKGDYIVFLNNDTLVMDEWLESLVSLIESDEKIGMVGSKLIYPDGRLQEAGGIIWKDASAWNYGRYQDPNMPEFNYVRETDYISGASIMIRRDLWEEIGGFDERFIPAYCEDSDLAFEVRKHGYKVMYQPKSVVVHFEGVSNGTELDAGLKKYQVENNSKLKEKWADELLKHNANGDNPFCMRERNYDKKVVLFIDHYVPTYDKDAGSKTTFQYIKMFLQKGYVVKFIGDNYAQMEPYTTTLQQMGVEVLYGPWYAEHIFEWIDANKDSIDFAYLNRPHISIKYIDFLKEKTNIKLIYYGHDLHFLRTEREAEITGNEGLLEEAQKWKRKEFALMKKASMSYYPSPVEKEAIHKIDSSIPVKAITAYVYDKFIENYCYDVQKRKGILFVGGFSHGPNIDAVKWFVEEVYTKIREQMDIPFIIVGSNAPDEIKALGEQDGIIFKGFVSDKELEELYATSRMVVVPLRYGAGVKGKVVEAIYNGLPIVTTSVGAEGIDGVADVLCVADEPTEFAQKVIELYDNAEKLTAMGNKTQDFIKEKFSVEAVWNVVKDDFQ